MESFFDLRELLIAILKRLKMIITITLIFAIGWAMVRFVPLAVQYLTYDSKVDETLASPFLSQEEQPYYYQARRTLYISPILTILGETYRDDAPIAVNAYNSLKNNKEILQPLVDEFFEEAKQEDAALKQKMVDCNYRTRLVFNEEYRLTNFYSQFTTETADHIVHIYFTSGNSEFSERVVSRAEELLTAYVSENIMPFSYKITEGQIGFWLPSPQAGLNPKTNAVVTNITAAGIRPTLSQIAIRTAKGAIWGFGGGLALSIFIVFFINVVGLQISNLQDLKQYSVKIIGYCIRPNKKWLGFIDKWISKLDGHITDVVDMQNCCKTAYENIMVLYGEKTASVLVSGLAKPEILNEFTDKMNLLAKERNASIRFSCSSCITYNPETIAASKSVDGVILVEQSGVSNKAEISREIEYYKMLEREVLGFVFIN